MNTLDVFKKDPNAKLPSRGSAFSVGWDLSACLMSETGRPSKKLVSRYDVVAVPTGLIIRPPKGYFLQVCSRSGLALHGKVFVANAPGVIDPDYTGELIVLLYNGGPSAYYVEHGHRIAQLVICPIATFAIRNIEEPLDDTIRGSAGLGSTGL